MKMPPDQLIPKEDLELTSRWLIENKNQLPERVYSSIEMGLKCCEAVEHLKFKIKDMIGLLAQHMGIVSKSEKDPRKKRWFGI
jgi:hypothetical protein